MKILKSLVLLLCVATLSAQNTTTYVADQLVIRFTPNADQADWLEEYNGTALGVDEAGNTLVEFDFPVVNDEGIEFVDPVEINGFIRQSASDAEVDNSSLNYEITLVNYGNGVPQGEMDFAQYLPVSASAAANYPGALSCDKGYSGEHKVRIGIIDTGIKTTANNHIGEYLVREESVMSESALDDNGHGTAVASIIVGMAKRMNISPDNLELVSIKALGADGRGTLFDLILAIDMAINGNLDIINLSWSYNLANSNAIESNLLKEKLSVFDNHGLIFAAAGNASSDLNTTHFAPAGFTKAFIVTVGGIDVNGDFDAISNYGENHVDIAAPSEDIVCYSIEENAWVQGESGTSFASPIAVFHAALYWFKYLDATYGNVPFDYEYSNVDILDVKAFMFNATAGEYGNNVEHGAITFDDICDGYSKDDNRKEGGDNPFDPFRFFPLLTLNGGEFTFSFYPNPSVDYLHIACDKALDNQVVEVEVVDAVGRVAWTKKMNVEGNFVDVPVGHLTAGNYWVNVSVNGQRVTHSMSKQ